MAIEAHALAIAVPSRTLLRGLEFTVEAGELLAIVGPNGAGKTTLLRTIAGAHPIAQGSVRVKGTDLHGLSWRARAQRAACAFGDDHIPERVSVRETVAGGRFAHHPWWDWARGDPDTDAVSEALDAVGIGTLAERDVRTLSAGERQRVWIALALAQAAPVLLFDEPTSHLDARYALEILRLLRRIAAAGRAVVAVLHDLNEAALFADRIALLAQGRLLALGTPAEVLTAAHVRAAYEIEVDIVPDARGRVRLLPRPE